MQVIDESALEPPEPDYAHLPARPFETKKQLQIVGQSSGVVGRGQRALPFAGRFGIDVLDQHSQRLSHNAKLIALPQVHGLPIARKVQVLTSLYLNSASGQPKKGTA